MSDLGNKEIFAKNLKYYMDTYSKDRNDICQILDVPYSTLSDWLNAKKYPRIDKIELLANYFNIQKSDLIESKENNNTFNELEMLFNKSKNILSNDDKETMMFLMKKTIDNYEKNKNNN